MPHNIDEKAEFTSFGTRISDKVGRHGHEPFAQKKAEKAHQMMAKAGFPELPEKRENKAKSR